MNINVINIDFVDMLRSLKGNWDHWPWQRPNEVQILQANFRRLDWILWIALPPLGTWWGMAPVLGYSLENWREQQKQDASTFKSFCKELDDAGVDLKHLPHTLVPYGYIDSGGRAAPIGYHANPQNILLFCSWLTPATDSYRNAFRFALPDAIRQLEEWNIRPELGEVEQQKLLALNATREKPPAFAAFEKTGVEKDIFESDVRQYIDWLNSFESVSPSDFSAAQLRNCAVDIWSWRWIDIGSRPLLRELVTARARFLQRLAPPFFYWRAIGALRAIKEGGSHLKTPEATTLAKELEMCLTDYIDTLRRRYPVFVHDVLAQHAESVQS